jgi:uncharacterized OB-fold protein
VSATPYRKPLPILADELSRTYWQAAREGRLLLQRCRACGGHQFYPRGHCARCHAPERPEWVEAKGTGRLHTFSIVYRTAEAAFREEVPYVFAVVELDEGVRLTANIVDTPFEELCCDMPVRVVLTCATEEIALPNFARKED